MIGAIAGALLVFAAFGYYAWKLAQLSNWLRDPTSATLPDAGGLWGEVLIQLYRMVRDERLNRQTLAATLSNFQQAASALPDGAVMLDNAYNIVWLNPTAEAHWDISRKDDRMQTITYLIRYPEFIEYLNARQYGVPLTLKLTRTDIGGALKEIIFTVQLVPFGNEQMLLLSRDITEYERLETIRRDFVANVSHELRTPITVMSGFLETIASATASGTMNSGSRSDAAAGRRFARAVTPRGRRPSPGGSADQRAGAGEFAAGRGRTAVKGATYDFVKCRAALAARKPR